MDIITRLYYALLLYFLNMNAIIESRKIINLNNLLSIHPKKLFGLFYHNKFQFNESYPFYNFNNNNTDKSVSQWIKDNTLTFSLIIVAIVVTILVIIILIYYCRKFNKKYKELQDKINKISFQNGIRESQTNDNEDQLI